MTENLLISAQELQSAQASINLVIFDCRFVLDKPDAGYQAYLESHIPGAIYAHLDNDLSSPVNSTSGRHPLPEAEKFASFLARAGWKPGDRIVVHDNEDGAIAARLWWLMRYFGQCGIALLDGGLSAWKEAGYELESGAATVNPQDVADLAGCDDMVMTTLELVENLNQDAIVLADARASERFMGEIEPIDRVAGHIPGAVNYPYHLNLTANGTFKPVEEIREGLRSLTGSQAEKDLVHMCGSGVTACHNILAAELAGVTGSKLYVGSWSEWIQDPSRPVVPKL
jgi:thiosulfate/3-mercaptopyruvate sulfurtransferase